MNGQNQCINSGKGQNELLEISNPLVQTRVATNSVQRHVPENRGVLNNVQRHVILASARACTEGHHCSKYDTKTNILTTSRITISLITDWEEKSDDANALPSLEYLS
jgi:hypothetical protein